MAQKIKASVVNSSGQTIYLTNKEMLAEIKLCKEAGEMSTTLAKMLTLLCAKFATKGCYSGYSYNEDMRAYAMMMIVRTWNSFNPDVSSNPFAFYTQCIKNSFSQYLKLEKRQRIVRDKLLITQGLNPSYGYSDGARPGVEDDQDFDTLREGVAGQQRTQFIDAPIERDERGREIIDQDVIELVDDLDDVPVDDATDDLT